MLLADIQKLADKAKGAVLAIGNFDGVHLGHRYLLDHARKIADQQGKSFVVLSFEPHPRSFFSPEGAAFRIAPETVKRDRLLKYGADEAVFLTFNQSLANMKAVDFIKTVLQDALQAHMIIVGEGFRFGYQREGSAAMMKEHGLTVHELPPLKDATGQIVSSSLIRNALQQADIALANELLGWQWSISGEVVHGDKRGRELGYPTANIWLEQTLCPSYGIYAVEVSRASQPDRWLPGAANIGIRPMFETRMPLLEVFLFDFDEELYGETLRVRPLVKIRDEANFDSLDDLIVQMDADCIEARRLIAEKNISSS